MPQSLPLIKIRERDFSKNLVVNTSPAIGGLFKSSGWGISTHENFRQRCIGQRTRHRRRNASCSAADYLDFHKTDRAVRTASSEQVRRPINRSGQDAWKPYEQWLDPLKDALGPLAP